MTNAFDHSDEDCGLNSEDLKFFKKRAKFLSLSTFAGADLGMEAKKPGKRERKQRPEAFDALEAAEDAQATAFKRMQSSLQNGGDSESSSSEEDEFDRRAKKLQSKRALQDESATRISALPIKSLSGEWKRKTTVIKEKESTETKSEQISEEPVAKEEEEQESAKKQDTVSFEECKEKLALLAMEITEDMDANVGKLKELLRYTRNGLLSPGASRESECELMRVGLITAVAVFKDILPEYSIRPLTEVERQAKVGKEVRKQRNLEETLLRSYGQYVDRLEEVLKTVKRGDAGIVSIAVACLGELASSAGHFNYYERILAALCSQVFNPREPVHSTAISGLSRVFAQDEIGRSTGHALRLLSDSIQARDYSPPVHVLTVLQHVRIKVLAYSRSDALPSDKRIASEEAARLDVYKKKAVHLSKSQKKTLKAELVESIKSAHAEAEYSREERSKWSSDALKFLFRILFGILKRFTSQEDPAKSISELLPEVMKCLCKCAQLLSVEYFGDLLSTLKRTIGLVEKDQSMLATLHTIQTVLQINTLQETSRVSLSTTKTAAVIDMKFYYDLIYRQLEATPVAIAWSRDFEGLFESVITKLFLSKKHCSTVRIAAFIHKFNDLSQAENLPLDAKIYFFKLLLRLLDRHEPCRGLLESETLGVAAYLPNCPDPDLCNPFCKQVNLEESIRAIKPKPISKIYEKVFNDLSNQVKKLLNSLK